MEYELILKELEENYGWTDTKFFTEMQKELIIDVAKIISNQVNIKDITDSKFEFIISQREKFIEAFVAETGLHPSECVMIEQYINEPNFVGIKIYFKKR